MFLSNTLNFQQNSRCYLKLFHIATINSKCFYPEFKGGIVVFDIDLTRVWNSNRFWREIWTYLIFLTIVLFNRAFWYSNTTLDFHVHILHACSDFWRHQSGFEFGTLSSARQCTKLAFFGFVVISGCVFLGWLKNFLSLIWKSNSSMPKVDIW